MAGIEIVTPSQVFDAIRYVRTTDPADKFGDKAFRISVNKIKTGPNAVRYMDFEILKKKDSGKWDYVPLNLKFMNLITKSKILPPVHEKREFPGVRLQFSGNASYTIK